MCVGVAAELDAGDAHFLDFVVGKIVVPCAGLGAAVDAIGYEEDGGGVAVFLECGEALEVVIAEAVVEGEADPTAGQGFITAQACDDGVEVDGLIPSVFQPGELLAKELWGDVEAAMVFLSGGAVGYMMIGEYGHGIEMCCCGGLKCKWILIRDLVAGGRWVGGR